MKRRGWYGYALHTTALLPGLAATDGDPFLAIGGQLLSLTGVDGVGEKDFEISPGLQSTSSCRAEEISLRIWILGKRANLQERLRALAAYHYGTESGVDNDTPNPWGLRLGLWRVGLYFGGMIAAIFGGVLAAGWISIFAGFLGILAGGLLFMASFLGTLSWMKWRSIPKDTLERSINGPLLQVGFVLRSNAGLNPQESEHSLLELLTGEAKWRLMRGVGYQGSSAKNPVPGAVSHTTTWLRSAGHIGVACYPRFYDAPPSRRFGRIDCAAGGRRG